IKAAFCLSEKLGVDMPITREIYRVLYKNKSPKKAVGDLMGRSLKGEI
ncbi:MAG: glycerol-3-phosphate dehydrogenase, partial [Candidatus Omnitrophota bacterium]